MSEMSGLEQEWEPWMQDMKEAIRSWRRGNDLVGLSRFYHAVQHLTNMIEWMLERLNEKLTKEFTELLPLIQELHHHVLREDVIAMTDFIEYKLIPFCQEWKKRVT